MELLTASWNDEVEGPAPASRDHVTNAGLGHLMCPPDSLQKTNKELFDMATKPRTAKAAAAEQRAKKTPAEKPAAEKSEESSGAYGNWQEAKERGMNFGTYLQNEKYAAAKTSKQSPNAAAETKAATGSYRRGRIWA